MPFRRKCDDELISTRLQPIKIPFVRGPIGPVLVFLTGYDPSRPVPFDEADPDGVAWLDRVRMRGREAFSVLKELPKTARVEAPMLSEEMGSWWFEG